MVIWGIAVNSLSGIHASLMAALHVNHEAGCGIPGLGLVVVTATELLAEHPGAGVVDNCGFANLGALAPV
jgi:hypothetical protein